MYRRPRYFMNQRRSRTRSSVPEHGVKLYSHSSHFHSHKVRETSSKVNVFDEQDKTSYQEARSASSWLYRVHEISQSASTSLSSPGWPVLKAVTRGNGKTNAMEMPQQCTLGLGMECFSQLMAASLRQGTHSFLRALAPDTTEHN